MTHPATPAEDTPASEIRVREFRHILVWPVQLMPLREGAQIQTHWECLVGADCPWRELADEFTADCRDFKERHYVEFVAFMPHVQRFLYGEGAAAAAPHGARADYAASPIRVLRRHDVARACVTLRPGEPAVAFEVVHVDLYFFYDMDVAVLAVELRAGDLTLAAAQDALFRLGRAYPTYWEADGEAAESCHRVEWLAADGRVLAASDHECRERYLEFVCRHRAPCIAAHWAFLLRPLALHRSEESGPIHYRQLEYQRMPLLAWLAVEDPRRVARADWMRLGLAAPPGPPERTPFAPVFLADFEARHCYDRFWDPGQPGAVRLLCSGHVFVMVGDAGDAFFTEPETGLLSRFRHQWFLLGLIAHFHRAALLMLSDRLVAAVSRLDIAVVESIKVFKRDIRQIQEIFLRFNHRYWFHEVSNQSPARDLFRLWTAHLDTDRLFAEVREEVQDMSHYLDSDGLRRQANSVVRLTVVTIFGLAGTLATGFLGMNLIAAAEEPLWLRALWFLLVALPSVAFIAFTITRSKRLADFLEALSDERMPGREKLRAFHRVWARRGGR